MKLALDELTVFLAVVDTGSLTAAAEHLGQPVSTISRLLARLEEKLHTTLLRRTTRRMDLTDEGCEFLKDARNIVESVRIAEDRMMERRGQLAGPLRVDAVTPFMLHVMVPLMPGYRTLHPKVELSLSSNEGFIDLLERRVDLAIRIGDLKDSTLYSRLLGHTRIRLLASPAYLRQYGVPHEVGDLPRHELLGFSEPEILNQWPLLHPDGKLVQIAPTMTSPSGETLRQLALQGMGIICMSDFMTAVDVEQGRLVEVLPQLVQHKLKPIHAVYYQHSTVSARIASMVNYLAEAMRAPEAAWPTLKTR
ncbi:LysR family transcriptional regulator [Duganella sp. sic0402]|uniref:LysR family transcriptional regulator n=1 Tax=Duganella sp. sic0402 TaxID=2854786 RepID=UPI001C4902EE|nr:LysR family transcriptional regulator [Duganella sp. sic0402]MBV7538373.1 LysR family transcriptional regulator [Duganella sp. sic0402]